jgi:hypothetical protein
VYAHTVVKLPLPPMDLTVSTNVFTSNFIFLNITWSSGNESEEIYYYVVHVIDDSTSDQITHINTTETQVQYNLSELNLEYNIDCYSLPSIVFSVSAVHLWSVDGGCTSEESEAKGIPDISFVIEDCVDTYYYTGINFILCVSIVSLI